MEGKSFPTRGGSVGTSTIDVRKPRATFLPFAVPHITQAEIDEVVDTLRNGWLTTGPKTKRFEREFARKVDAPYAVAVNSATADGCVSAATNRWPLFNRLRAIGLPIVPSPIKPTFMTPRVE